LNFKTWYPLVGDIRVSPTSGYHIPNKWVPYPQQVGTISPTSGYHTPLQKMDFPMVKWVFWDLRKKAIDIISNISIYSESPSPLDGDGTFPYTYIGKKIKDKRDRKSLKRNAGHEQK